MHDSSLRRRVVVGAALTVVAWLAPACGRLPQQPGNESYRAGFVRSSPLQEGYNGTIKQIPTSIDPRTPQTEGTPGRSLVMDAGERALLEAQRRGVGGSGAGPQYEPLGAEGSGVEPSLEAPAEERGTVGGGPGQRSGASAGTPAQGTPMRTR
jgi:hypothetical protein